MCKFMSGFINARTMEVKVSVLDSHSETAGRLGIKDSDSPAEAWREMHYTPKGEVECRLLAVDPHTSSEAQASVIARWPRWQDFCNWAFGQHSTVSGWLDVRGLDLKGVEIPDRFKGKIIR